MERASRERLRDGLAKLANGDRSAFTPLFETLWPLCLGFATRLARDPAAGEEIAQQALVKLFAAARRFDPERDALSWTLAFVANEARAARRARRHEPLEAAAEVASGVGDPARAIERRRWAEALSATLATLSPADLETLVAALEEAAAPRPAAFRKRLQRATQRLRAAWRKRDELA